MCYGQLEERVLLDVYAIEFKSGNSSVRDNGKESALISLDFVVAQLKLKSDSSGNNTKS